MAVPARLDPVRTPSPDQLANRARRVHLPVAWIGYTLIHGGATNWYPYPFLDADHLGYPIALRNIAAILVMAAVLAVIFRLVDRFADLRR